MSGPAVASSMAAESRTVLETICSAANPFTARAASGPIGLRFLLGFRPNKPQHAAGHLIDPPASLACAIGTMPEATAAAAPPEEPPGVRSRSHGLSVGPYNRGSVAHEAPNSGMFVRPRLVTPDARNRL